MTAQLSPAPVFSSRDNNGLPLVGGQLFTYAAGTTTPQATYVDSTQTTPNTNPVILNFRGEAFVWLNPLLSYKYVLFDSLGNLIWTEDNIQGAIGVASNIVPSITNTFTLGTPTITFANAYFGPNGAAVFDPVSGNIGYYARTAAEIAASVTPTDFSFAPGNLLRYGGVGDGSTDNTAAINRWLSVSSAAVPFAAALYAPAGTYNTAGGHTINPKQDIYGDGIQRTIFQHTSTSNILFSIPLYGGNQATVEFGGNRFRDFSCVGQGPTNLSEVCWYVKNKTDIKWDHIEITGFGYGVQGARDNAANSCTDLTFIACRVLNCGYALWSPLQWNSCQFIGGCWEGTIASVVIYDASNTTFNTNVQNSSTAICAVFAAGCQGCTFQLYCEGSATVTGTLSWLPFAAFVILSDSKDINNLANPGGINIQHNFANRVVGGVYGSGTGVAYACLQNGGSGCAYDSINAGSGIAAGVVYVISGSVRNYFGVNRSNPGTDAVYQTPTDQPNNFDFSASALVAHLGTIDTGNFYLDGGNTSDTASININQVGYQGGTTHFRRVNVYDGKGSLLMQIDGATSTVNIASGTLALPNLPTTNPGAGSKQVWVNAGVLTRA